MLHHTTYKSNALSFNLGRLEAEHSFTKNVSKHLEAALTVYFNVYFKYAFK